MAPLDNEEQVRKRVVYEDVSSSSTSGQTGVIIAVILIVAIALVVFIFMHR